MVSVLARLHSNPSLCCSQNKAKAFDSIIVFYIADKLRYPIGNDDFSRQIAVFIPSCPAVIKHILPCFRSSLEQTKKLERELLYPSSDLIHDFGKTRHL